jgi:pilus assembly protein CpaB
MKSLNKKIWIIAAIFSLLTTLLLYKTMSVPEQEFEQPETVKVYTASRTIPARSVIVKEMISENLIPKEYIHPNATVNLDDIVGKMTIERIIEGEQIIVSRLSEEQTNQMSYKIPEGKRALTIAANEIIVTGNHIYPGDFVDIVLTLPEGIDYYQDKEMFSLQSSRIIMENIEVLAVGQAMYSSAEGSREVPNTITLAVTPVQVEQLVLAEEIGRVRLALRPVGDEDINDTPGAVRLDISAPKSRLDIQPSQSLEE